MENLGKSLISNIENGLNIVYNKVQQLNPKAVIDRGYIKARVGNNALTNIKNVVIDDEICLDFVDGTISTKVTKIEEK